MVTFTALAKIYSSEYFCNARVAGIGEIFVQRKFSAIRYMIMKSFPCSFILRMKVVTVTTTPEEGIGGERGGASQGVGESELSQKYTTRKSLV